MQPDDEPISAAKAHLRARLMAARRNRGDAERQAAREAITAHLLGGLAGRSCIAAYLPLPTEPLDTQLLDHLAERGRVLVPVVTGAAPLDWCQYPVRLRRAALGIDEPTGTRLGPDAIADADAILVPALAVDRHGRRLGRGGGHYDRTLELHGRLVGAAIGSRAVRGRMPSVDDVPKGLRIAVLYDDELLETVPFDDLDQRVCATVTPDAGLRPVT